MDWVIWLPYKEKSGNTLIIKNKQVVGVDIVHEANNSTETPIFEEEYNGD